MSKLSRPEFITKSEGRGLLIALKHCLRNIQSFGQRGVFLVDNMSLCLAITRGRSSSPNLVSCCRSVAALLLATGFRLACRWIPSEVNISDGPSRGLPYPAGCTSSDLQYQRKPIQLSSCSTPHTSQSTSQDPTHELADRLKVQGPISDIRYLQPTYVNEDKDHGSFAGSLSDSGIPPKDLQTPSSISSRGRGVAWSVQPSGDCFHSQFKHDRLHCQASLFCAVVPGEPCRLVRRAISRPCSGSLLRRTVLEECTGVGWLENGCCLEIPPSVSNYQWESSPSSSRSRLEGLGSQEAGKSADSTTLAMSYSDAGIPMLQQGHHCCNQFAGAICDLPAAGGLRRIAGQTSGGTCKASWSRVSSLGFPSLPNRALDARKDRGFRRVSRHRPTSLAGPIFADVDSQQEGGREALARVSQGHHELVQGSCSRARPRFSASLPILFEAWRGFSRLAKGTADSV